MEKISSNLGKEQSGCSGRRLCGIFRAERWLTFENNGHAKEKINNR